MVTHTHRPLPLWSKILMAAALLVAVIFSIGYAFLAIAGEKIIVGYLENATHRKITYDSFYISPISTIHIKNLNVNGIFRCDSVFVMPNIMYLLFGNIAISNISFVNPELTIEKRSQSAKDIIQQHGMTVESGKPEPVKPKRKKLPGEKKQVYFMCERFSVRNGTLKFIDYTAGNGGITIVIKDISANLTNVFTVPVIRTTNFSIKGSIPWREGQQNGSVSLEGWLNYSKKDIQAQLMIKDIDGIYLQPYYSNWVNLEKARIEKANLNFTSDISGLNNKVKIACHLELADIVRKPAEQPKEEVKPPKPVNKEEEFFSTINQGKIVLDFNFRTKMDNPEFGFDNIKMDFQNKAPEADGAGNS